jgi:hypothetical protein
MQQSDSRRDARISLDDDESNLPSTTQDHSSPNLPDEQEIEATGATVRSVVCGGLIGGFVSAGSMYISFKSGQSLSSSLFCMCSEKITHRM